MECGGIGWDDRRWMECGRIGWMTEDGWSVEGLDGWQKMDGVWKDWRDDRRWMSFY